VTIADLEFAFVAFTAVLFVVDPFAAVPIFLVITRGDSPERRRRTALRASVATFVTLCLFGVAGGVIFKAFGISLGAFKAAGGLMLLLMALDMMRAQPSRTRTSKEEEEESVEKEDVAIVPMAIPMLAGPGAIATVMVLMSRAAWQPVRTVSVLGSVAITCLIGWLLLRSASGVERFLKKGILNVFERVMGLLLAAVAFEFLIGGLKELMPGLGG
jgi:multiple antibiotic resistance protein